MQVISFVLVWRKFIDFEKNPDLLEQIVFWHILFVVIDLACFMIFQKRELKQFFSYQELKKKQELLLHVFDAQSDAVIVVGQDAFQQQKDQEEYELVE